MVCCCSAVVVNVVNVVNVVKVVKVVAVLRGSSVHPLQPPVQQQVLLHTMDDEDGLVVVAMVVRRVKA